MPDLIIKPGKPTIHKCDGCGSWTAERVTITALLSEWGWVVGEPDEYGPQLFCPECR